MATESEIWAEKSTREADRSVAFPPFEPSNGGVGCELGCVSTTSRAALVGYGDTLCINNTDVETWAFLAFGDVTVTATTACFGVPPGSQLLIRAPGDPTHVAGITRSGTTDIQICRGVGN